MHNVLVHHPSHKLPAISDTVSVSCLVHHFWHCDAGTPTPLFVIPRLNLGVCVEELEQGHGERLHTNVATLVLLDVVGHGLSLCLGQQQIGLLLQRTPSPHTSWGQSWGQQALMTHKEKTCQIRLRFCS